jgi:hypothetical protein
MLTPLRQLPRALTDRAAIRLPSPRSPWLNAAWQDWDDNLCRAQQIAEAARLTGRTIQAARCSRQTRRVPDGPSAGRQADSLELQTP